MHTFLTSHLDPRLRWLLTDFSAAHLRQDDLLGPASWHRKRRISHTASLLCLASLAQIPAKMMTELSYFKILDTQYLCSRSHTENYAAACLLENTSSSDPVLSVGIDLEPLERQIKPGILKFYQHAQDEGNTSLENWCAKEAAYKALSSYLLYHKMSLSKPLTLKDFIVKSATFQLDSSAKIHALGRIEWVSKKGQLICLAVLDRLDLAL